MPLPLAVVFADLPDPRRETANKRHQLTDILTIAVCAVLSGADTWEQMAEYGRRKEAFFRRFLPLANGIPSHDTFYRLFCALDPDAFAERFGRWMAAACEGTGLVPVAIDGKAVRAAVRGNATGCLCVVSAWATANRLTLGQVVVPDGTSEIGVIPDLLRALDLAGALVTLDAAGCQTGNADIIREAGGHYLLAVKGNQPGLDEAVRAVFDRSCEADFAVVRHDTHEGGRGRARAAGGAVHDGRVRPGRVAGRVAGRGGGGAGEPGAAGERGADGERPLPDQPRRECGPVGRARAGALGDRERPALGAGRGLPGGRQPHAGPARRGQPGAAAAGGRVPAEAGTGQGQPAYPTPDGRLGRRVPAQSSPRYPCQT